jgi:hypothetical protein
MCKWNNRLPARNLHRLDLLANVVRVLDGVIAIFRENLAYGGHVLVELLLEGDEAEFGYLIFLILHHLLKQVKGVVGLDQLPKWLHGYVVHLVLHVVVVLGSLVLLIACVPGLARLLQLFLPGGVVVNGQFHVQDGRIELVVQIEESISTGERVVVAVRRDCVRLLIDRTGLRLKVLEVHGAHELLLKLLGFWLALINLHQVVHFVQVVLDIRSNILCGDLDFGSRVQQLLASLSKIHGDFVLFGRLPILKNGELLLVGHFLFRHANDQIINK